MAYKGIDVRETGDRLVFRSLLQDSDGALLATGTTTLKLYELQNDGTLHSYDFNDNTFKSGALTTETQAMTHRQGDNSTTNTGLWTWALTTLTGFTAGNIYFAMVNNTGAFPVDQQREFQFGDPLGVGVPTAIDGGTATLAGMITKLADDNDGGTFNAADNSQWAIRNAITAAADAVYNPDSSSSIVTGNQDSGTYASTATNDGTYWDIGDTGAGVEVVCECNLGTNRFAQSVDITGYFDSGASRIAEIYVWNYTNASYDKLSNGTDDTEMRNRSSNKTYTFALSAPHTNPVPMIGEVKILILTAQSNSGDTVKLDYVGVTGVSSGGLSPNAIADAVWKTEEAHDLKHIKKFVGETYYLSSSKGDDSNIGTLADQPWATWAKAIATMIAGDRLLVFADAFTEANIVFALAGIEIHCEIGVTMTGGGSSTCFVMTGPSSFVSGMTVNPAAGQKGIQMDGVGFRVEGCNSYGGTYGFDLNGNRGAVRKCTSHEATVTHFDAGADDLCLRDCFAGGVGGATRGFHASGANSHVNVTDCLSIGNATASYEIASGATYNSLLDCNGDIEPTNSSGNATNQVCNYKITSTVSPGNSRDAAQKDVYDRIPSAAINDYKADVSGLSTFDSTSDEVDIGKVKGAAVTNTDDFKADVSGLSVFDSTSDEVDIGAVKGVAVVGVNDFKSDVSALGTSAGQTVINDNVTAVGALVTTVDTVVDAIKAITDNLPNSGTLSSLATAAAMTLAATDITIIRKLRQNRTEFDIDNSKVYIWNDAGDAREYEGTLTDSAGASVTTSTQGPINCSKWTAV